MSTKSTFVFGESFLYGDTRLTREAHLAAVLTTPLEERGAQRRLLRQVAHFSPPRPKPAPDASTLYSDPASSAS